MQGFKHWFQNNLNEFMVRRKFPGLITGFTKAANTLKPKSKDAKLAEGGLGVDNPWIANHNLLRKDPSAQFNKPVQPKKEETPLEQLTHRAHMISRSLKTHKKVILSELNNSKVHPFGAFNTIQKYAPNTLKVIRDAGTLSKTIDSIVYYCEHMEDMLKNNPQNQNLEQIQNLIQKLEKILAKYEQYTPVEQAKRDRDIKTIIGLDEIAQFLPQEGMQN